MNPNTNPRDPLSPPPANRNGVPSSTRAALWTVIAIFAVAVLVFSLAAKNRPNDYAASNPNTYNQLAPAAGSTTTTPTVTDPAPAASATTSDVPANVDSNALATTDTETPASDATNQ